jgi:hypothetical protein
MSVGNKFTGSGTITGSGIINPIFSVVTGGVLTSDSTYYYRTFMSSDTLTVSNKALVADILTIGGGASGSTNSSGHAAGGGGGGGVQTISTTLNPDTYLAEIGAGGSYSASYRGGASFGNNGNPTSFGSILTAESGKASANTGGYSFQNGGNAGANENGVTHTGGPADFDDNWVNAGGGGGGAGENGHYMTGGHYNYSGSPTGGDGTAAFNSWGIATSTGVDDGTGTYYYAGGGGSGSYFTGGVAGGKGGGMQGYHQEYYGLWSSAPAGSGGGTGGVGWGYYGTYSQNGGSGLVIVRYTKSQVGA